jgi:hypothetical protein
LTIKRNKIIFFSVATRYQKSSLGPDTPVDKLFSLILLDIIFYRLQLANIWPNIKNRAIYIFILLVIVACIFLLKALGPSCFSFLGTTKSTLQRAVNQKRKER